MDKRVFDDAIGEVPPSTVDVDAVIVRGRRAARLRRVANPAVAAGVAVVLLTGAVAYTMTGDTGGGTAVGTAPSTTSPTAPDSSAPHSSTAAPPPSTVTDGKPPPPSTTDVMDDAVPPPQCEEDDLETAGEAAGRLEQVVTSLVLAQRPDLRLVPNVEYPQGTPRGPLEFYQIVEPGAELPICDPHGRFESTATTKAPDGTGNLLVLVSPDFFPDRELSCETNGLPGMRSCAAVTGPHGEEIVEQTVDFEGGIVMHRVEFVREDGMSILVQAENVGTSSKYGGSATATAPPLTVDQLVAIGTDPALTLFP